VLADTGLTGKLGDKTILITGFTTGIGLETAKALAETRAKMVLVGKDTEKFPDVTEEIDGYRASSRYSLRWTSRTWRA
jgi:NADP-dependent 3-hydroxy acid dehydrogenase YdfG